MRENQISSAKRIDGNLLVIGTNRAGLMTLDLESRQVVDAIQKRDGLQDNHILTLFVDQNQHIWAGLNHGIDHLDLKSPFRRIIPDENLEGAAFAAAEHQGWLYLGTSTGLYAKRKKHLGLGSPSNWELISGTEGQVWGLTVIGEELWLGHHRGAFLVEGLRATFIPGTNGVWTFIDLPGHPAYRILGTYQGLDLVKWENGQYQYQRHLEGFEASSRFLVRDQTSNYWVSHPYRGVFRLRLSEDLQRVEAYSFKEEDGLLGNLKNHVFSINEQVLIASEFGLLSYDAASDSLILDPDFAAVFSPENRLIRMVEASKKDIWFLSENGTGVIQVTDRGLRKAIHKRYIKGPFQDLNGGFELIYPLANQEVLYGLERGFLLYQPNQAELDNAKWEVIISQVSLRSGQHQVIYGGFSPSPTTSKFSFASDTNAFRFLCGATYYGGHRPPK
ncbi:MAG: hypothetical protein AAF804_17635, partial [Bacteroidota bacterium]